MLKFAVFDSTGPAKQWTLRHAHLLGPDDVAFPADIRFDGSLITITKRVPGASALALQYPVPNGGGVLTLRTCLLPERERPYLLPLELARRQIMILLNKLEEWALFDFAADDPAIAGVQKALDSFTHALVVQNHSSGSSYTLGTARAAAQALHDTLAAGEALALLCARVQHTRRVSGELGRLAESPPPANALTDHESRASKAALAGSPGKMLPDTPKIGCAVSPSAFTPELCAAIAGAVDFVTLPMRWVEMEPQEGKYAFAKTDRWIEWAVTKAKLPVVAGPLLDFSPECVPEWLYIWEHDYETLRDVIYEHVKTLVTRYRRTVNTWTVVSGLHTTGAIALSPEQALDLTRGCILLVRKLQPTAKIQVELAQPWGEYTAAPTGSKAIPPMLYAEWLNQLPIPIDSIGVRLQMGHAEHGQSTRDLMSIAALLDRVAQLDKPIAISCWGAPSSPPPKPASDETADIEDLEPGYWHAPWSPEQQAAWLGAVGALAASKPYVCSLSWQDLFDPALPQDAEMPAGGLMSAAALPKVSFKSLKDLRIALRDRKPTLPGV